MKYRLKEKDQSIVEVINNLYERLGQDYFDIVDHWEDDLDAIGIGSPTNNKILVYITTVATHPGHYDVHLELPPVPN